MRAGVCGAGRQGIPGCWRGRLGPPLQHPPHPRVGRPGRRSHLVKLPASRLPAVSRADQRGRPGGKAAPRRALGGARWGLLPAALALQAPRSVALRGGREAPAPCALNCGPLGGPRRAARPGPAETAPGVRARPAPPAGCRPSLSPGEREKETGTRGRRVGAATREPGLSSERARERGGDITCAQEPGLKPGEQLLLFSSSCRRGGALRVLFGRLSSTSPDPRDRGSPGGCLGIPQLEGRLLRL